MSEVVMDKANTIIKDTSYAARMTNALVENLPQGVVLFDYDKKVIMVNTAMMKMTGLPKEGFYLSELSRLFAKQIDLEAELDRALTTTTTTLKEISVAKFFYNLYLISVFDDSRNLIGGMIVLQDVTREKEIEKLRVDFLSLASHQLRTPLSGTKWLIETMQQKILGPVAPRQKEYLDEIYQLNERMIKLVSDMLNVLRLESGSVMAKKEKVSVLDFYEKLSVMMEPAAKGKGIILRNILKNHKEVFIETDATMLQSILECFVSNAINYSSSGQEVILDAKEESTAVVFFVKDSGIGIPKEEQKRIFERFYRASNAKILKPEGTGLGLYIASMLAEKIGAEILFDAEENKGSTFYLRIPKKPNI